MKRMASVYLGVLLLGIGASPVLAWGSFHGAYGGGAFRGPAGGGAVRGPGGNWAARGPGGNYAYGHSYGYHGGAYHGAYYGGGYHSVYVAPTTVYGGGAVAAGAAAGLAVGAAATAAAARSYYYPYYYPPPDGRFRCDPRAAPIFGSAVRSRPRIDRWVATRRPAKGRDQCGDRRDPYWMDHSCGGFVAGGIACAIPP